MLNWIIETSLKYRWMVIASTFVLIASGIIALNHLDIDAFPDTTPVQVQINTVAPALGPEEIEQQITFPIEQKLGGLPRISQLRSISKFGLSQVVVIFEDGTDIYFARQIINERLGTVQLPPGLEKPKMGPVSTGLGEVFHYIVTGKGDDITQLRTIHDWVIRPQMRTLKGVAEVNSWGGFENNSKFGLIHKGLLSSVLPLIKSPFHSRKQPECRRGRHRSGQFHAISSGSRPHYLDSTNQQYSTRGQRWYSNSA